MDTITTFFIEIALRSSLVLGMVLLAVGLMFRRSAAERHFILTLSIALLLLLPAGLVMMPAWRIGIWTVIPRAVAEGHGASGAQAGTQVRGSRWKITTNVVDGQTSRFHISGLLIGSFLLGASALGARLVWGWYRLEQVRRMAWRFPVSDELGAEMGKVDVLVSDDTRVAFVMGLLRPAIVLPASAAEWPEDHLKMVLCHELGHLRRGDHWVQAMCCVARLLYWWQPLMWLCLRALQRDRELACDDSVIGRYRASDYAGLLLSVAGEVKGGRLPSSALAMAASSNLEERICSVLDGARCRNLPGSRTCGTLSVAGLAAILMICAVRLGTADTQPVTLSLSPNVTTAKPESAAKSRYIEIQSKFVEITDDAYQQYKASLDAALKPMDRDSFEKLLKSFAARRGVDMVSSPMVTTKVGTQANITIGRDFRYPAEFETDEKGRVTPKAFETRTLGVQLNINPELNNGEIWLTGEFVLTELGGFTKSEAGEQTPVFEAKEAHLLRRLEDGQWVGIILPGHKIDAKSVTNPDQDSNAKGDSIEPENRLLVFLSARVVTFPQSSALKSPALPTLAEIKRSPISGPKSVEALPYGKPVPNKPGFVTSPYAPKAGYIDLRGYRKGTEVKDPYTGKIFLVP